MINVCCVLRKGGKVGYDASWVEKLNNSLLRNLTIPFNFYCLSDCDVPCSRIPLENIGEGYWAKLQLFRYGLFEGPVLFFDLDTIICNNINDLVTNITNQNKFLMWRDPDYSLSSSAIMYWNGDYSFIYDEYLKKKDYFESEFSNGNPKRLIGDQAVISTLVDHLYINDFCPQEWIQVMQKKEKDYSKARILIFRKAHTKPSTMTHHKIVQEHWK
jgi:hypothetical protein